MTPWPSKRPPGRPKAEKKERLLIIAFLALALTALMLAAYLADRAEDRAFNAMSPAKHLEAARLALKEGRFDEGLRQLKAIAEGDPQAL